MIGASPGQDGRVRGPLPAILIERPVIAAHHMLRIYDRRRAGVRRSVSRGIVGEERNLSVERLLMAWEGRGETSRCQWFSIRRNAGGGPTAH